MRLVGFALLGTLHITWNQKFTSPDLVRFPVMKHSTPGAQTRRHQRPLSFWDFIRFSVFLTFGVTLAMFVTAAMLGNPLAWSIALVLCPLTILILWIGTLTVGCLVMIPVSLWRLSKLLTRKGAEKTTPQGRLWDQWIDGPEPL